MSGTPITITSNANAGMAVPGSPVIITIVLQNSIGQRVDNPTLHFSNVTDEIDYTDSLEYDNITKQYTISVTNTDTESINYEATIDGSPTQITESITIIWRYNSLTLTSNATEGSAVVDSNVTITITLRDSSGTLVDADGIISFADPDTGNDIIPTSTETGIYTALVSTSTVGALTYIVTATIQTDTFSESITINWTAAESPSVDSITLSTHPSSKQVGEYVAITATAYDQNDKTISDIVIDLTGDTIADITSTTNEDGTATFSITESVAGLQTYTISSGTVTKTITITWIDPSSPPPPPPSGAPSIVLTSNVQGEAESGSTVIITATIKDSSGTLVDAPPGLTMFDTNSPNDIITPTNSLTGIYTTSVSKTGGTFSYRFNGSLNGTTLTELITITWANPIPVTSPSVVLTSNATQNTAPINTNVIITITVRDSSGTLVDVDNTIGSLSINETETSSFSQTPARVSTGLYTVSVPGTTIGNLQYTVVALINEVNITQTITINWTAPPSPASMTLVAVPPTQQINNDVILTATVSDATNTPLQGQSVSLSDIVDSSTQLTNNLGRAVFTRRNLTAGVVRYDATCGNLNRSVNVSWTDPPGGGGNPPCFLEGTTILCYVDGVSKYIPVETLVPGTLVRTSMNGLKKVVLVGTGQIENPDNNIRIQDRLYKLSVSNYPELKKDLFITGCHSILVRELTAKQTNDTIIQSDRVFVTEKKYRLMACVDEKAEPWNSKGTYTIWHFALEHDDVKMNYGAYANGGLLVETCCIDRLENKTNFTLIK